MSEDPSNEQNDSAVLVALLAMLFFVSPLMLWWSSANSPWYAPFVLWGLVVLLGAALTRRSPRSGN